MSAGPARLAAVVLAGGLSSRFGTDKLAADLDGSSLLEQSLNGLPADAELIIVGPERSISRPVRFVCEKPPGTGPAAALITGLGAALAGNPKAIVVLPGDAPSAGHAAMALLAELEKSDAWAVMASDASDREQPLQLALRPEAANTLVQAAGKSAGAGQSARLLVRRLKPRSLKVPMSDHFDVDTSEQLIAWQLSDSPAVRAVLELLEQRGVLISSSASSGQVSGERPYLIAIDGPSGSGKSTFATALALRLSATVIEGDDFYSPRLALLDAEERDAMSDGDASAAVIDWKRLRAEALDPLLARQSVYYLPYDWEAGDGSLGRERRLPAADVIIIDGVYSFRPELADLIDLSVFVKVAAKVRKQRLDQRQDPSDWSRFWDRAERHYFTALRPPEAFDLRITSAELDNRKDS